MNKERQILVISIVVTAAVAFAGGVIYGKTTSSQSPSKQGFNGSFQRDMAGSGRLPGSNGMNSQNRNRGGFTNGEIIKKDDKSITLKLNDGGSKIVFFTASTTVSKMTTVVNTDLQVGANVMVSGSANSDGSMAADMVQIRPAGLQRGEQQPVETRR